MAKRPAAKQHRGTGKSMKVSELKEQLELLGLDTSGKKAVLAGRLAAAQATTKREAATKAKPAAKGKGKPSVAAAAAAGGSKRPPPSDGAALAQSSTGPGSAAGGEVAAGATKPRKKQNVTKAPALYAACQTGDDSQVQTLLRGGAVPDSLEERWKGRTPLQTAAQQGHHAICKLLLACGRTSSSSHIEHKVPETGSTALHLAVSARLTRTTSPASG